LIDEALDWLEQYPDANKEEFDAKQKEVEQIANPIMRGLYSGGAGSGSAEDMGDFGDDEL
jgi:hypothetical protein